MLEGYLDWPHAAQVGRLEKAVTVGGRTTVEARCIVTSVPRAQAGAATLLAWTRGHWAVENKLHYVRDVTMGEDANRTRAGSGPQALATLRNLAVSWLRLRGVSNIAAALRRNAARVPELIEDLRRLKN
jgi:hypothetical protein